MLKSEEGFGTSEALIAVSSVFMVIMMFIPLITGVVSILDKKESEVIAARVLYEHLEEELFTGKTESNIYQRQGAVYIVFQNKYEGKLCTAYKDYKKTDRSYCIEEDDGVW